MLDGLWNIKVSDTTGLSIAGLVLCHGGVVMPGDESITIAGSYETRANALLAKLEVLLLSAATDGSRRAERIYLHVQGQVSLNTISASGVDLSDAWRRADIRFERRGSRAEPLQASLTRLSMKARALSNPPYNRAVRRDANVGAAALLPSKTHTTDLSRHASSPQRALEAIAQSIRNETSPLRLAAIGTSPVPCIHPS